MTANTPMPPTMATGTQMNDLPPPRGVRWAGRPGDRTARRVRDLAQQGLSAGEVAKALGVARTTVFKAAQRYQVTFS